MDPVGPKKLTPRNRKKKKYYKNEELKKKIEQKEKSRPRISNQAPTIYPYEEQTNKDYYATLEEEMENKKKSRIKE